MSQTDTTPRPLTAREIFDRYWLTPNGTLRMPEGWPRGTRPDDVTNYSLMLIDAVRQLVVAAQAFDAVEMTEDEATAAVAAQDAARRNAERLLNALAPIYGLKLVDVPYGYAPGPPDGPRYLPDPPRAAIVHTVFARLAAGESLRTVYRALRASGHLLPYRDGTPVTQNAMRRWIDDRRYLGHD